MKNWVLFLFWGMLSVTCCTKDNSKDDSNTSGKIGSLTWELTEDGVLAIIGIGEIPNYWVMPTENLPPWFEFRNDITDVIIGNDVSKIGDYAFFRCSNLGSVTIGNSVTTIGRDAFSGCSSLKSVIIPNSITNIGHGAFYGCTDLKSITIGNSVKDIGDYAFYNCSGLTEIINMSLVPQKIIRSTFNEVNMSACTLFVPADSENAYREADVWEDFEKIEVIQ